MKIKNTSARAYHIRGILIAPGATETVPDDAAADVKGMDDLEVTDGAQEEKGMTKAELQTALTDKGIEYPSTANKAELQALLDAV